MTDLDRAIRSLDSPDVAVRADAVRALVEHGESAHVGSAIMRMLSDDDELVRSEAVDALGILVHLPALDELRAILRTDPSALVRAAAAESLGDLGQPSARAALARRGAGLAAPTLSAASDAVGEREPLARRHRARRWRWT